MRDSIQQPMDRFLHVGVEVHGVDDFHIAARRQLFERSADVGERLSEVFAAMGGDENESASR